MSLSNFQRSLAAVLVGNLIYFLLMPVLPPIARLGLWTNGPRIDLGLVIDFVICSVLYVLIGRIWPEKKRARTNSQS
jgi:hypothetical protein